MNSTFFTKIIEITPQLSLADLVSHANQFLRYNNVNDLVQSGPDSIQWFLNRVQTLFKVQK